MVRCHDSASSRRGVRFIGQVPYHANGGYLKVLREVRGSAHGVIRSPVLIGREAHLTRVLTKLGAARRAEIAA